MTDESLREAIQAAPFLPFTVYLADGVQHHVPHPDYITLTPNGTLAAIARDDNSLAIIDVSLVTQLVIDPLHAKHEL